jgi:hypothetical protein
MLYELLKLKYSQNPVHCPPIYCHPCIAPREALEQKFPINFKWNALVKSYPCQPPSANICGNINVPLNIMIMSDTVPCHFVSSGYTVNSLEHTVLQVLYTNNNALTNKTNSSKIKAL